MTADIEDYGGLDWGSQNHRACLVDRAGKVVGEYDVSPPGGALPSPALFAREKVASRSEVG